MSSDIILNDGETKDWVTIDGTVLAHRGSDLMVDSAPRRSSSHGFRRALVHTGGDGLTINFNNDYPGGVTINDLRRLRLRPIGVLGRFKLPAQGTPGDVIMVNYMPRVFMPPFVVSGEYPEVGSDELSATLSTTDPIIDIHGVFIEEAPVPEFSHTLWVCVGNDENDRALWSQIPLGDPITGE